MHAPNSSGRSVLKFTLAEIAIRENLKSGMWEENMQLNDVGPSELLDLSVKTGLDVPVVARIVDEMKKSQ